MRVLVIGSSGSGKTTFARKIAAQLDAPHLELDSMYHQPNWTPMPDDEFRAIVTEFMESSANWAIDGNYRAVREIIIPEATDLVWLDYPRRVIMPRVIWRSARRATFNRELWNGNRESMRNWIDEEHPIRYSWNNFHRRRREYPELLGSPECAHLRTTRVQRTRDASEFLRHCKPA